MAEALDKDPAILSVLDGLRARLGHESFDIVDHWESDLCAVGIASRRDHGVLAYLSCFGEPEGRWHVELELPPLPSDDLPYRDAGRFPDLDVEAAAAIIRRHFGLQGIIAP